MKGKYSQLIQEYCEKEGISIPVGFYRGTANHLAIIRLDYKPPKLVARTYFNKEDVKYYIKNTLNNLPLNDHGNLPAKIIDFKDNIHFIVTGDGKLERL